MHTHTRLQQFRPPSRLRDRQKPYLCTPNPGHISRLRVPLQLPIFAQIKGSNLAGKCMYAKLKIMPRALAGAMWLTERGAFAWLIRSHRDKWICYDGTLIKLNSMILVIAWKRIYHRGVQKLPRSCKWALIRTRFRKWRKSVYLLYLLFRTKGGSLCASAGL